MAERTYLEHDPPGHEYRHAGLTFLADNPYVRARSDDVLGVGPSGLILANLTPRRQVDFALDLGCGCGLQALLAARHSENVIATDINPRAVALTADNAVRNGISNFDSRHGDLFEPVSGLTFDLITSNPPYVISPDETYIYRDGGQQDGGICRRIVSAAPDYLRQNGFAVIQIQWPLHQGESWWREPGEWVADKPVDLWLVGHGVAEPRVYAQEWIKHSLGLEQAPAEDVRRWVEWYRLERIEWIASGVLVMRRRSAENWRRAVHAPRKPDGECGDQIERLFHAQDELQILASPIDLWEAVFSPAPHIRLGEQSGSAHASTLVTAQPDIGWGVEVSSATAAAVAHLDGRRALAQAAAAQAGNPQIAEDIRQLYGAGFLERR